MPNDLVQVFEQYPPASWTVSADKVTFAVKKITERGGNRIVQRERPYRDGAKLDDTGSKARVWTVEAVFDNSIDEPGIPTDTSAYPAQLNAMCASADTHETGDLTLPTRGTVRARLESYERVETDEERSIARCTFTFVQDNEDNVGVELLSYPSVRASMRSTMEETTFSMESAGGFWGFLEELENAASDIEDAIAAPGEWVQDVDQKVARIIRLADNIERQAERTAEFFTDRLSDPDQCAAWRQLRLLVDRVCRAAAEKKSGAGKLLSIVTDLEVSIFDVAVRYAQDPVALMQLNSSIPDLLSIPARSVVRILEK